ncbi:MAG: outer membrane protein assembly factor [Puniceicoccaceae bacterium]
MLFKRVFPVFRSFRGRRASAGPWGKAGPASRPEPLFLVFLGLLLAGAPAPGQENIKVRGMGLLSDMRLKNRLSFLQGFAGDEKVRLDSAMLEDTAFILLEQIRLTGHLRPKITGIMRTAGGEVSRTWTHPYSVVLPADFEAESVVFRIEPGVLYYYDEVRVTGIESIPEKEVLRYFVPTGRLFVLNRDRFFTPGNLEARTGRLVRQLNGLGHLDARLVSREAERDDRTGAVRVRLRFEEGPLFRVRSLEVVTRPGDGAADTAKRSPADTVDTLDWRQDVRRELANKAYRRGYPDVSIEEEVTAEAPERDGVVERDYRFTVEEGKKAFIGRIVFAGDPDVKRSILRRQTDLRQGELLDFLRVSEGRRKLMALGVFNEVNLRMGEPDAEGRRDVVYTLKPGLREELGLLAGWGSYELARVGIRWRLNNPFHRAHRIDLDAKQSLKATSARGTYSIPQIFGTDVTAFSRGGYLYREEITFDREVAGISVGVRTTPEFLPGLTTGLEYQFESQRSIRADDRSFQSRDDAIVAGVQAQATLDRVDNSLFPTRGYQLSAVSKTAGDVLGGNVDFQKIELGAAVHHPLTDGLIAHAGLRYGGIFSWKPDAENIPFSERFFLGGENSIRGYRSGEAAPVDSSGELIGGQAYLLGNLELEQRVVGDFSVVVFYDAATISPDSEVFTDGVYLDSVGLGVNYRTMVGPVRLEYGYNLNPQPGDPVGTLLFAFGFPF